MKKLFTLLVTAVAVVALVGCAKKAHKEEMPQQDQSAYQSGNAGKLSSSKLGK